MTKVIIAAAKEDNLGGWLKTKQSELDLLNLDTWYDMFYMDKLEAIMIEHVLEHFTQDEVLQALATCYIYLEKGGHVRIAVPDGYHPNSDYIESVKPGGSGAGANDHKELYTYKTLSPLFEQVGFTVKLLEYWDENGKFHYKQWNINDGKIRRSKRFDWRNTPGNPFAYTSLIVDGVR